MFYEFLCTYPTHIYFTKSYYSIRMYSITNFSSTSIIYINFPPSPWANYSSDKFRFRKSSSLSTMLLAPQDRKSLLVLLPLMVFKKNPRPHLQPHQLHLPAMSGPQQNHNCNHDCNQYHFQIKGTQNRRISYVLDFSKKTKNKFH